MHFPALRPRGGLQRPHHRREPLLQLFVGLSPKDADGPLDLLACKVVQNALAERAKAREKVPAEIVAKRFGNASLACIFCKKGEGCVFLSRLAKPNEISEIQQK